MVPLPLDRLDGFERRVEATWCSRRVSAAKRRDALVMGLGLCGLRWVEVSRVRRGDVLRVSGRVRVRSAKGGVPRCIVTGRSWTEAAVAEFCGRGPGSSLFCTGSGGELRYEQVRRRCREWTSRFFGEPYSFHCLRHTAAVRLYEATRDVVAVQRMLGHRSLKWTSVYLQGLRSGGTVGLPAFVNGRVVGLTLFDPEGLVCRRRPA